MENEQCSNSELRERVATLEAQIKSTNTAKDIAFLELNRRLNEMNEFRAQLSSERANYVQVKMYDERHRSLEQRIGKQELWTSNMDGRMWMFGIVLLILNAVVTVGLGILFHFLK